MRFFVAKIWRERCDTDVCRSEEACVTHGASVDLCVCVPLDLFRIGLAMCFRFAGVFSWIMCVTKTHNRLPGVLAP